MAPVDSGIRSLSRAGDRGVPRSSAAAISRTAVASVECRPSQVAKRRRVGVVAAVDPQRFHQPLTLLRDTVAHGFLHADCPPFSPLCGPHTCTSL
ncbi:hypothetical protein SALBM135S_09357 [Streptomyces alboniger]